MSLEHFKTQVLLLHSQQSTLDVLGTGFNDRYTVHFATSGTEALNTLTETPIHVIVSAQDLPGMSGLDALREAKKRSPDTIGILLAGTDENDGLEAVVNDRVVFQVVRGEISPEDLKDLIDNATRRVRLLALSESANDLAANPDEPVGEHIVMETSENGSTIISDGTGRLPTLKPEKVAVVPSVGGSEIDVLVLTQDDEFLATIRDSARGLHNIHHANTPKQAQDIVGNKKIGVLVTDAAMVGSNIEALTHKLRQSVPRLVAVVAGRRDDGELLMDLINRGHVYRFLLKPVSPGRARLAIEASVKHHLEADDSSFKPKKTAKAPPIPEPKAKAKPKPEVKPQPKLKAKPIPTAKPKPESTAKTKAKPKQPVRKEPTISATPDLHRLSDAHDKDSSFTQTMTDIASSVGKSLAGASESIADARSAIASSGGSVGKFVRSATNPLRKPKNLAIAAGLLAVIGGGYWAVSNWGSTDSGSVAVEESTVPKIVESEVPPAQSAPATRQPPAVSAVDELLDEARRARGSGYIYTPPGINAVELYVAAMAEAPDNAVVASELQEVVDQTLGMIEKALLEQRTDDAVEGIQIVRLADPDNSRLVFLDVQIKQMQLRNALDQARAAIRSNRFEDAANSLGVAEAVNTGEATEIDALKQELAAARSEQEVDDVLALANERLGENKLIEPSNDNARYYYELALSNDPDNQAAQQGISMIASKLVLRAREAIDRENFELAGSMLGDAETLDPASIDLAASKSALDEARARQAAEQQAAAERQAEVERLAEAERRVEAERVAALERQAELERQLEAQRKADAEKRAELERQLKAQIDSEAQKRAALEAEMSELAESEAQRRAELQRQMTVIAENESRKRAELERELELQAQAEADKRAELERQLAARKAADQKRSGAELAAAAVAAANAQARAAQNSRTTTQRPTASSTRSAPVRQEPVRPEPSPSQPVSTNTQTASMNQLPVTRLSPDTERTSVPTPTPSTGSPGTTDPQSRQAVPAEPERVAISQLKRTKYVPPKYPRSAQRRNTSGWVDIRFTVGRDGTVHSIEVIDSDPGSVFDEAATKAISQWRFEPVVENGVPVEKRAAVRMAFSLD